MDKISVFILTHGRPDRVYTYDTLRRSGFTGDIYLVVDNLDKTAEEYKKKYGDWVIVFDKEKSSDLFDVGDNNKNFRGVVYARNAVFGIAKDLGIETFIILDDDYKHFQYRFNSTFDYKPKVIKNLDRVFAALIKFYKNTNIYCLAIAQGGDFIGGEESKLAKQVILSRKLMNLYVVSSKKPFEVMGRLNEDVCVYTNLGSRGKLFFTLNQISLEQLQTQSNPGGLTELYLDSGTYVKSFYSVLFQPSFVKVAILKDRENARIHHRVIWENAVPKILREEFKKI